MLFFFVLFTGNAGAQSSSSPEDASVPQAEYGIPLDVSSVISPPQTSSPRMTLASFLKNMNQAHFTLMKAHRENLQTPGLFPSESVQQMARQAQEAFQRGVECLDLSGVADYLKTDAGAEGAIMLKEVLDRIALPPLSEVPDEIAIDNEEDPDKKADMIRWRLPNTDIFIELVGEGEREGEFLFNPKTIARLPELYSRVKEYPYKIGSPTSPGFYEFYVTTPGRLLPPKWNRWLPAWSNKTYLDQTVWQWCALILMPLVLLLLTKTMVRWWYHKTQEMSSGSKTIGWLSIVVVTVALVSLAKYVLDEHINITGGVLVFLENTLQRIFFLLLIAMIFWEYIRSQIKENIENEELEEQLSQGEEGGAGGSRSETLLLLMRKALFVMIFTIVSLLLLSSMGVNIGPLLAGAGVVGLAIGFGAQTLVRDIIAGIFFLIDDAFRVGDYIETGGLVGTVEHISLRSLRLRSARGPVHTIPFGNMGTVTNNSRDYIITKLNFRVRYDTDVDKVRKIIKSINKQIMDDELMGPVMLDKIKSQGVMELDDSAMIMRVKFKTIPGQQFVIRREVYRMMQEAFQANGIEFAHRNVTVYFPQEGGDTEGSKEQEKTPQQKASDQKIREAAGAAAMRTIEENKRQG